MIERIFRLQKAQTNLQREISGGLTTFITMAYIIFVQPAVLGAAGMDPGAVMVATCLSSAFATFLMGFLANYPIALAPAMGHNFFFAYTVVLTLHYSWQQALGATFISGLLFIIISFVGLRERLVRAVPSALKNGIAVGIGLLIALVGLEWAGIVVDNPGTLVGLGKLSSPPVLLSLLGLTVMSILLTLRVRTAMLLGILLTLIVGLMTGMIRYEGIVGPVPSLKPTLFKLDIMGALETGMFSIIFVFFFLDLFDTVGTLIGVSEEAGFLDSDGSLPRARQALLADAIGTVSGALLGTSTVTSYIESATGVSAGARTGLSNVVTGILFLLAIFFAPLVKMIGGGT
jgi:AGZA family xanthine/uracil permease-like MFS transporter